MFVLFLFFVIVKDVVECFVFVGCVGFGECLFMLKVLMVLLLEVLYLVLWSVGCLV